MEKGEDFKSTLYIKDKNGGGMVVLLLRRLEINLSFDTGNRIDILMTGIVLLLTFVVVHFMSLRPHNIPPSSGSSQTLGKPSYCSSCWVGIAVSQGGRKQIHGSVSVYLTVRN